MLLWEADLKGSLDVALLNLSIPDSFVAITLFEQLLLKHPRAVLHGWVAIACRV